jgi:hypothetical protein
VYNLNSVILQHAPIIVIAKERLDEYYEKKGGCVEKKFTESCWEVYCKDVGVSGDLRGGIVAKDGRRREEGKSWLGYWRAEEIVIYSARVS